MNTATINKIAQLEHNVEILNQFGIELDLNSILLEEFEQGLSSDISNGI